ncbi:MAG: hypothetical protein M3O30_15395 [Planctomycetota bacterium]|nr:hypothetical protein [Planctomycetota bacterium]
MSQPATTYPDWKAPAEDADLLIWPEPAQILGHTLENHRRLAAQTQLIQGIPLHDLRRRQRQWLGLNDDRPAIADGHQTELYHPGVWAKLALLNVAAAKIDADSVHFAIDTDASKHLTLRWPGGGASVTDDPALTTAEWSGLLANPTPQHLNALHAQLTAAAAGWSFHPIGFDFLDDLRRQSLEQTSFSMTLTNAMHQLDWGLGLKHQAMIASPIFACGPYLVLTHHLLANACEFAGAYNQALSEYRKANRVRTPGRPMPDLLRGEASCEVPFWLDDLGSQSRSRATVQRKEGRCYLSIADDSFEFKRDIDADVAAAALREFLRSHNARLSPRALTLTMFLRLFVADQFIHGIGGARYDQVTDRVITLFFGMEPPAFCVTTSTLYFPTALGRPRACVPCLLHEGHQLRHATIGAQKTQFLDQIEQLPRGSFQRQRIYHQMHELLATALVADPRHQAWQTRMAESTQQAVEDESIFDRELFYAMQPKERLLSIIDRYQQRFS